MPLSHLTIVPCPNGKTAAGLHKVSVFLTPRLREAGTLRDYVIWRSWGQRVNNLRFQYFAGSVARPLVPITRTSAAVNPNVWAAVFGDANAEWDTVAVRQSTFVDHSTATFLSMDAAGLAAAAESTFAQLAKGGAKSTTATSAGDVLGTTGAGDFASEADEFFGTVGDGGNPGAPDDDFHAILRKLGAHPDLMRRLGLIIDLELDLRGSATPITEIQLRTNFPNVPVVAGGAPTFTSREQVPLRMLVDANGYALVAQPAFRSSRWIDFGAGKYAVNQGGSAQYTASVEALVAAIGDAADVNAPIDVPAVEETGLRVINKDVVNMITIQLGRQKLIEDQIDLWLRGVIDPGTGQPWLPPTIMAEDAAVGIRWDVRDTAKGTYRSLHQRKTAGYDFPRDAGLTIVPPADEGWWTMAVSTDGSYRETLASTPNFYPVQEGAAVARRRGADNTDWRVSADFMLWSGWSLSVQHPARAVDRKGELATLDPNEPLAGDPAQVAVDPYVPVAKSLERLRFSHTYQFRGRCVDLCGNSEPLVAVAPTSAVSPVVKFGRTVPVPPPDILRRQSRPVPGVGDMPDVLVIKSELTQTDASTPKSDRMFFTPRAAQARLERHGLPAADGIDVADYNFLKGRDAKVLADQLVVDPTTGELIAGGTVTGGVVAPGAVKQKAQYLPDGATAKMAFHSLPNRSLKTPILVATGTWPTPESVILELAAGTSPPKLTAAQRRLTVSLPKGTTHPIAVSSALDTKYLQHFKWNSALTSADQTAIKNSLLQGSNTVFSPSRSITLVHAVRVPLTPPAFGVFSSSRPEVGQTVINVDGSLGVHRRTTDRVVLGAVWSSPDPTDPSGLVINPTAGSGLLVDSVVADGTSPTVDWTDILFDIGDTRRHEMLLTAEAFCRFSSYFTERLATTITKGVRIVVDTDKLANGSVRIASAATGTALDVREHFRVDHAAGTITPRLDSSLPNGTEVEIDYIPLPVSRRSAEAAEGARTVLFEVPSSAAPPPPVVDHVLPAFARTVTSTSTKITVLHDGRVVRVLMTPRWNASGQGELLGVAAKADGTKSRWGRDAIVAGATPTAQPALTQFTNAIDSVADIDGQFDVAGHPVAYDAARNLLTADVAIDAPGYRPFVELDVCRYQPLSIDTQHVSTTVKTDVLRLGAVRSVTATKKTANQVEVVLTGPDNVNAVTVRIEDADPAVNDPLLRWRELAAPVVLTRTGTTAAATHRATFVVPDTGNARRLIVEDAEPVQREIGGVLAAEHEVAYREVIELPDSW